MQPFNIFRASFDGSLPQKDRRKARIAAIAVTGVVLVAATTGFLTLLHQNSEGLSGMANAGPASNVRVLGAETADGKPCEDQTWPFIEARCLTKTDPAKTAERTAPKQGLASRDVVIPPADKQSPAAEPRSSTLIAPTPPVAEMTAATTGAAPRIAESDDDTLANDSDAIAKDDKFANVPLPPERPAQMALASDAISAEEDDRPLRAPNASSVRSERELQRFWKREQRELREQARREDRRARAGRNAAIREERIARRRERMVRRWSDDNDFRRDRFDEDVVVIRRGFRGGGGFEIFR